MHLYVYLWLHYLLYPAVPDTEPRVGRHTVGHECEMIGKSTGVPQYQVWPPETLH